MVQFSHSNPPRTSSFLTTCALLFLSAAGAWAQSQPAPAIDATALIRRAIANHMTATAAHHPQRFVLHKKDDKRDYTQTPSVDLGTNIFWSEPSFGKVAGSEAPIDQGLPRKNEGVRLERSVTLKVFFYPEVGLL